MKRTLFILVLLFAAGSVYSQGLDTVWTYNLQPDYLKNAVFSPDEQFVFATHYDYNFPEKLRLTKFEKATGKFLWTTDSIMGIKQFSEDGKYFYTYDLKKYSYPEFKLINFLNYDKSKIFFKVFDYDINEKNNLIYAINDRQLKSYDSCIFIFDLTTFKLLEIISSSNKENMQRNITVEKNGNNFVTFNSLRKVYSPNKIVLNEYVDFWNYPERKETKRIIEHLDLPGFLDCYIKYSPDGKLLGILTDSLRFYETENYSWVYTLPLTYITYFNFSYDSKGIFLSSTNVPWFRYYKIFTNEYTSSNAILNTTAFINQNKLFEILTTKSLIKLSLVKFNNSSIENDEIPFIKEIIQKDNEELLITSNNLSIKDIDFEICNVLGKIIIGTLLENVSEIQIKINISSLKEGIYFLRLKKGSEKFTHKFIVVR